MYSNESAYKRLCFETTIFELKMSLFGRNILLQYMTQTFQLY